MFIGVIRDISERRAMQRDILRIAEEEQRRIGQDLHDGVGQELTGLGYLAQNLVDELEAASPATGANQPNVAKLRDAAVKIADGIGRSLNQVQSVSRGLVLVPVDAHRLTESLEQLASDTDSLEGVTCALKCHGPITVRERVTATHLYRIAQEAVANALKHGRPETILIVLRSEGDELMLRVIDDGAGMAPGATEGAGMGLKTMRYRAGLLGGQLTVEPADGHGTVVTCTALNTANAEGREPRT